jgi:prepilin-type N-terminal cleavage/methylation domain-containing protein
MVTRRNKKQKGFTLIELLIVISIIGLLSSIVMTSMANARIRSRDAKRLADMRAINVAIEQYKIDLNESAPYNSGWVGTWPGTGMPYELADLVARGYLAKLPSDPKYKGGDNYYYRNIESSYICSGDTSLQTYCIRFKMEASSAVGPAGNYCLTSRGIHRAGRYPGESQGSTSGFTPNCTQQ